MSEGLLRTADDFRAGHHDTLGGIRSLVDALDDAGAMRPSGCPGWTVRDVVAHVTDLEAFMLGDERPHHEPPADLPHVRSPLSQLTEIGVDMRRTWPLQRVCDEYREVTARRLRWVDGIDDDALQRDARGVLGTGPLRTVLTIRVFDIWTHEQDMRRALGTPGGLDGPAAAHSQEMLARGVGRRVAERLQPADGTVVLLDVTSPRRALRTITFSDGKPRVESGDGVTPNVTLRMDLPTLTILGCGRHDDAAAQERVRVEGDAELGRRILEDIAATP